MVVFGGLDGSGDRNDVWELSLAGSPAWSQLAPTGTAPTARHGHTAIYDPVRDCMVVFGGFGQNPFFNDVWALSLAGSPAWSELVPTGTAPAARYAHTAIYDPVRDRMVVFGGDNGIGSFNDVWALSLAGSPAWSELVPTGTVPDARYGHTAIYDPVRDRMVVFGGYFGTLNDVWALSLAGSPAWSKLVPTGTAPAGHGGPTAIYDPVRDRMVVFGGFDGSSVRNNVWALSLAGSPAWSELVPAGTAPAARYVPTAIYDPVRDRMVVFGGNNLSVSFNDVWALTLAASPAWSVLVPAGTTPAGRAAHTAIYDPVRDRMVVFGGVAPGVVFNDVWALTLAGSPAWSNLAPTGTPPAARYGHTAIYDPVRDRIVLFGGRDRTNFLNNDVWTLSLGGSPAWSVLSPTGTAPAARGWHTAIYDPVRDRMVVFGGYNNSGFLSDVWALSLAGSPAWSELVPTGTAPGARYGHTAIYDPVRDRMVVFAGGDAIGDRNDVWALSLAGTPAWSELVPTGTAPTIREQHTAIYDPIRDRMVVFGGTDGNVYLNDVWALSLAGSPAWSALAPAGIPPTAREGPAAIYDPVRGRMVGFGGYFVVDVWSLSWDQSTPTLLARFEAEVTSIGVRLRWQFGEPERVVSADLERATNSVGPWMPLALETHFMADATEALDQSVVPGQDYYYRLSANLTDGTRAVFGPISAAAVLAVKVSGLTGIAPNPASASARIDFALVQEEKVRISVVDVAGREAAILADGPMAQGSYSILWDGRQGSTRLPAGVYFVRWASAGKMMNRRLVLVR